MITMDTRIVNMRTIVTLIILIITALPLIITVLLFGGVSLDFISNEIDDLYYSNGEIDSYKVVMGILISVFTLYLGFRISGLFKQIKS